MRQLAQFDRSDHAEVLAAVLYVEGIETRVDRSAQGPSLVWVIDEQHLPRARDILREFEESPDDPRFLAAKRQATAQQRAARKKGKQRGKPIAVAERWRAAEGGMGPVTFLLLGASTLVFMVTFPGVPESMGTTRADLLDHLLYERTPRTYEPVLGYFSDVLSGQVWRLITPIFVHAEPRFADGAIAGLLGFAHFLFNMFWLRDLGSRIESRQGWLYFLGFVLVAAILSNTAQYVVSGGNFIGMSGVVYGVFGYAWIRGRFDPGSGYALSSGTVSTLLLWMAFGFAGFMHMANWAHLGGLAVGAGWGFLAAKARRR